VKRKVMDTSNEFQMMDPMNSVNEPLFWLHHGAIDYYWNIWQEADRSRRVYDVDTSVAGDANAKALAEAVEMGLYGSQRTVKEIADTVNKDGSGTLCYKYAGPAASAYIS